MEKKHMANEKLNHGISPLNKIMLLMIGGGIGAATALLFVPKPGRELRRDVTGLIDKGYDRAIIAASEIKDRTSEYYEAAKGTSEDVLEVVSSGISVIKDELRGDVEKINSIVQSSVICGMNGDSSIRYRLTESGEKVSSRSTHNEF